MVQLGHADSCFRSLDLGFNTFPAEEVTIDISDFNIM